MTLTGSLRSSIVRHNLRERWVRVHRLAQLLFVEASRMGSNLQRHIFRRHVLALVHGGLRKRAANAIVGYP